MTLLPLLLTALTHFIEPDAHALWAVSGPPGSQFGWAVSELVDIDGDGADDVIVGAPSVGAGEAVVLSGATGATLLRLRGLADGDQLGYAIADAGDVDGDGLHDIVAGAPSVGAGYAAVFSGADGTLLLTVLGEAPGDRMGAAVSGGGDVDGDGLDDVVIGAEGNGTTPGRVVVVSGADGSVLHITTGAVNGDHFGSALSRIGDVSGDGIDDHVVGARDAGPEQRGQVFVLSGADGTVVVGPLEGGATDRDLGYFFVGGLGDVDGDGVPDVYGGDFGAAANGLLGNGAAYVWSGADGSLIHALAGDTGGAGLGCGRTARDVDGDGVDDLTIGSYRSSEGAFRAGKIGVYSGADGSLIRSFTSRYSGENLGFDTVGVGDVNGDGHPDLVGSAATADRVYLLRGRP